jgi:nucleoside-diphosphate-sugar epimerase
MQKGDVERTWADISKARSLLGYDPKTSLADGIARTIAWRRGLNAPLY